MAVGVGAVAGTKFYIGPAGSAPTSPDLWVEVGNISSFGDIMLAFDKVKIESVGSGDSYDLKGTRSVGSFDITMNRDDSDVGQIALKAAQAATRGTLYPFKVVDYDGTTPGVSTWQGEVFGFGPTYGGVNGVRGVKTSVSIKPSTLTITLGV